MYSFFSQISPKIVALKNGFGMLFERERERERELRGYTFNSPIRRHVMCRAFVMHIYQI